MIGNKPRKRQPGLLPGLTVDAAFWEPLPEAELLAAQALLEGLPIASADAMFDQLLVPRIA